MDSPVEAELPAVGFHLSRLVSANSPALHSLNLMACGLCDAVLAPVMAVLPNNTWLHSLDIGDNECSAAFNEHVLLPAVAANTGLRNLFAGQDPNDDDIDQNSAEQIFADRAMAVVDERTQV